MGSRDDVGQAMPLQSAQYGRTNHASMDCNINLVLSAHLACSAVGVFITDDVVFAQIATRLHLNNF